MTRIEILGPGCSKCKVLYERAEQAARELGIEYEIAKVTDITAIIGHGVMTTPALVVNGDLKLAGRVPTAEQLKGLLS
ncbi:MAG TPA: thioredoxin family protein [Candidatus Eisenbacteria bacterium]